MGFLSDQRSQVYELLIGYCMRDGLKKWPLYYIPASDRSCRELIREWDHAPTIEEIEEEFEIRMWSQP